MRCLDQQFIYRDNCMYTISRIGIIGSGRMGSDIASLFEGLGLPVAVVCENAAEKERQQAALERRISRLVKNGLADGNAAAEMRRAMVFSEGLDPLAGCGLVIEAVPEDLSLKQDVFSRVEAAVSPETVLATNSSSLDPSRVFVGVKDRGRCLGMHFFYPARLKNILELIYFSETSPAAVSAVAEWLASRGRRCLVQREEHAFILNRVFLDFQALGFWLLENRGMSVRAIDDVVRADLFPDGLFSFFDSVGLDVMLAAVREYARRAPSGFYSPMVSRLEAMTLRGMLGRKSGRGFYDYASSHGPEPAEKAPAPDTLSGWLAAAYVNTACRFIEQGACSAEDMDYAVSEYMGTDSGPVALAARMGREKVVALLDEVREMTGCGLFNPSPFPG